MKTIDLILFLIFSLAFIATLWFVYFVSYVSAYFVRKYKKLRAKKDING